MTSAAPPSPARDGTWLARAQRRIAARPIAVIVLVFVVGHWALLLNPGIYWDDWTSHGKPFDRVIGVFVDYGTPLHGYVTFFAVSHPFVGHLVSGLAHLTTCLAWRHVLTRSKIGAGLDATEVLVASLVFVAAPFNFGRVALINTTYNVSLAVFSLATVVLLTYLRRGGAWRRVLALIAFGLSFTTSSLLFFYVVPLLVAFVETRDTASSLFAQAVAFVKRFVDFLILAPLYFVIHGKAFPLRGAAATGAYNTITGDNVLALPLNLGRFFKNSPLLAVRSMAREVLHAPAWSVLLLAASLLLLRRLVSGDGETIPSRRKILVTAASAVGLILVGVFPYLLVGKPPANEPFFVSRHELLVPFGVAAGVLAAHMAIARLARGRRGWPEAAWIGLVLTASLVATNVRYVAALREWVYVESLRAAIARSAELREHTAFLVDEARMPLESGRTLKVKELNGYLRAAFGDERRLALAERERDNWDDIAQLDLAGHFNFGEFVHRPPQLLVHVEIDATVSVATATRGALDAVLGHDAELERLTSPLLHLQLETLPGAHPLR